MYPPSYRWKDRQWSSLQGECDAKSMNTKRWISRPQGLQRLQSAGTCSDHQRLRKSRSNRPSMFHARIAPWTSDLRTSRTIPPLILIWKTALYPLQTSNPSRLMRLHQNERKTRDTLIHTTLPQHLMLPTPTPSDRRSPHIAPG